MIYPCPHTIPGLSSLEHYKKGVIRVCSAALTQHIYLNVMDFVQIFLCLDAAAISRIMTAAQLSLEKLAIVSGSRSMYNLVLCFRVINAQKENGIH